MSLLSRTAKCVSCASALSRGVPCQSRSKSQAWPLVKTCGKSRIAVPGSTCPEAVLSVPAGPRGIASSDLVRQLFSGKSRTHGQAAESSAVPADPDAARLSGVSGTRSSDPSPECTASGRAVPIVRDWPSRPACSPAAAASTVPCSSSSGAGPSALRQSRQARSGAGCHRLDQGSRARSPASARITPDSCASGIKVHSTITRIMNAADSSRRYRPLTYLLSRDRALRDAVDHSRPGLRVQPVLHRAERRVVIRAAPRPDLPAPGHHRLRDRYHLQEHRAAARADLLRPPDDQRRPV
jgi:hypothetical protein